MTSKPSSPCSSESEHQTPQDDTGDAGSRPATGSILIPGGEQPDQSATCAAVAGANPAPGAIPAHYVIVRESMPAGVAAAQIVHAVGESTPPGGVDPRSHAVVVTAKDTVELERIASRLREVGLSPMVIYEQDPPYNGAPTAIGLYVLDRAVLPGLVRHLPRYGLGA